EDARVWTEETFGPLLPIMRVKDLDEALEKANASEFGLGSSIFTRDMTKAQRGIDELEAGYTWVNAVQIAHDELPFGGTKHSGYGKEHGTARSSQEAREALETVAIRDTRRGDRKGIKGQKPLDFPRAAGTLAESRAVVVGRQARPLAAALVRWLVTLSRETMAAAARR